jgi:predicted ATPase/DNA-binding CsgD family transcriptional regulator
VHHLPARSAALPKAAGASFVGRQDEVAQLDRLLRNSRLVTLTGPGGVGKTRLMIRAAEHLGPSFRDGVALVDLATLTDPELLVDTVASALGVIGSSGQRLLSGVLDYLTEREVLLLLDNCEQMLDACAVLVDELIASTSTARVLATSRERLNVGGEMVLAVPTLAVPDLDEALTAADVMRFDAVRLFDERARATARGFAVTDQNASAVAALCARLDGLPLAIELAAARMNALTVKELLDRIDARFTILTSGSRAAAPRQRTLHALIDWSFKLCSRDEQTLWAAASVFSGGFDLYAVEQVCGGPELPADKVIAAVAGLVDKSVLIHNSDDRFLLLENIRKYGVEVPLESRDALTARHRDYYRDLACRASAAWAGPTGEEWRRRLRADLPNLRAALEYCCTTPGQGAEGLRINTELWLFWRAYGLVGEGRKWFDRLLAIETAPSRLRTEALCRGAWMAIADGDADRARIQLRELTALADELHNETTSGYIALLSGDLALVDGDVTRAEELLERALSQLTARNEGQGARMALARLALAASSRGATDQALGYAGRFLDLCSSFGTPQVMAHGIWAHSVVVFESGDMAGAKRLARQSIQDNWDNHDRLGCALGMEVVAWADAAAGQPTEAARLLGSLDRIWQWSGTPLNGYPHLLHLRMECLQRVRTHLGSQQAEELVGQGRRLSFEDTIELALHGKTSGPSTADNKAEANPADPLTEREREVALLVAQGLSNREVATRLVISPRTAEGHVERILRKLDLASRVQIANWVSRQA